ncbi:MAG: hypothetical protein HY619_01470, partial [Thaumarchaeota archaeon]|nr:hypothetical protein [Nitrososphaerota archaeon]
MVAKAAEKSRALVFDATAFYAGILSGGVVKGWTTPKVVDEVSHNKLRGATIEGALAAGILEVREASSGWAKKVVDMASESGDLPALSEADLSVLALAAELKEEHHVVVVVSDDYAVVNVAKMLGLDHRAGKKGF